MPESNYSTSSCITNTQPAAAPQAFPTEATPPAVELAQQLEMTLPDNSGKFEMRPEYARQSLTASVEQVLRSRRGKPMTVEAIAEELYGELSQVDFLTAKQMVTNSLSQGGKSRPWQKVKGQRGVYVLR